jgi:hypothetical protein
MQRLPAEATRENDMSTQPQTLQLYLLSIRGTLAPATLEEARGIHNQTAGAPESVAGARSLGDLSHMVYVPAGQNAGAGAGEILILDIWQSIEGLNTFFANPQVQQGAGMIFSSRDPQVWAPAGGFTSYHLPAPKGQNERFIGVVRGPVQSRDAARAVHNAMIGANMTAARKRGQLSHEAYFKLAAPGSADDLEFFAVDVWSIESGMNEHYDDPAFMQAFGGLFTTRPDASTWQQPSGQWQEW